MLFLIRSQCLDGVQDTLSRIYRLRALFLCHPWSLAVRSTFSWKKTRKCHRGHIWDVMVVRKPICLLASIYIYTWRENETRLQ